MAIKNIYNSVPVTVTVESLLPVNKGQAIVCNAEPAETGLSLIEAVCKKMNIAFRPHFFLRLENGQVIHINDHLGQALRTKGNQHHYSLELDTHYVSKSRWFGALAGLLLGLSALVIGGTLFAKQTVKWQYGIVADAGSSHTSFLLFNWPENHLEAVQQIAECTTAGSEGIDRFASNPEGIKPHFQPCLDTLASNLTGLGVSDLSRARIYLGATAGMRLANISSQENSSQVMQMIEEAFDDSPFFFVKGDVKILTGQEEGAFSWITTNILAGTFNTTSGVEIQETTFGSLDMGGASMQIAYECVPGECEEQLTFDLYDKTYEVFAKSDLCYGVNEATKRYVVSLIYSAYIKNNRTISPDLENKCYTRSNLLRDDWLVNFTSVVNEIFDNPCTTDLADAEFASAIAELETNFRFFHRRSGNDSDDCRNSSSFFVDTDLCRKLFGGENCFDFDPESASMPELPAYYAMSSYYYEFFRYLNTTSNNVSYEFAQNRIGELCSPDFVQPNSSIYSQTDCFQATYIFEVITSGYKKFDESNFDTIFFALDINGAEVSWALGFLVNEVTQASLLGQLKRSFISTEIFVCLVIFGLFLLGLSVIALRRFCSRYSSFRKMMQPTK